MNQRSQRIAVISFFASLAAAIVFSVLRIVLLTSQLDFQREMFTGNSVLPTVFNLVLTVVAAALFATVFFIKAPNGDTDTPGNPYARQMSLITTFAAALTGFLLVACFVLKIYEAFSGTQVQSLDTVSSYKNIQQTFSYLVTAFCVPAAVYFFITAVAHRKNRTVMVLLAVTVVLWNAFLIIATYFNMSVSFNSPIKLFNQASIICVMAFVLNEARYYVGFPKQRLYLPVAFVSILLIGTSTIPDLFFAVQYDLSVDLIYSALQFVFLIYIISRVCDMLFAKTSD